MKYKIPLLILVLTVYTFYCLSNGNPKKTEYNLIILYVITSQSMIKVTKENDHKVLIAHWGL